MTPSPAIAPAIVPPLTPAPALAARPRLALALVAILVLALGAPARAAERDAGSRSALTASRTASRLATDTSLVRPVSRESAQLPAPSDLEAIGQESVEVVLAPCSPEGSVSPGGAVPGDEGGLVFCGPETGIEVEGSSSVSSPEPSPEPAEARAYDLFAPYHDGPDPLQAYLLAAASFYMYAPLDGSVDDDDFPDWLEDTMQGFGLETAFLSDPDTDTEAAVLWNDDVVILGFRGTTPTADFVTDAQKNMRRMPDSWGDMVLVHNGFAVSWEAIRDDVIDELEERLVGGRRLWITGHSLGGALATLAAYDLDAVEGIPVEGVHTFGQPRVGGDAFYEVFMDALLYARFHRWQLEGDPVPAFYLKGGYLECGWVCTFGWWDYVHVGRTHDILVDGGPDPEDFEYDFDLDHEDHALPWHLGGFMVEHVKYDNALHAQLGAIEKPGLMELLPPLVADEAP